MPPCNVLPLRMVLFLYKGCLIMQVKPFFKAFPVIFLLAASCGKTPDPVVHQPLTLPEQAERVIAAQNEFTFRLFKNVLQEDNSPANKLVSPLSIYLALSMAYNGSAGETQAAMGKALQLTAVPIELLNKTNQQLITGLPKEDSRVSVNIANSIWYRNDGYQPLAAFLEATKDYYLAEVSGAAFNSATVNRINDWVAEATRQKIKTILSSISPSDVMYLVNATYFKGQWKYKFDADKTKKRTFYATGGDVQTPFMMQKATFNYTKNDSLQLIELPYGAGDFNMYILLPNEADNLTRFASSLNVTTFNAYLSALDSTKIKLYLPKWKYQYEIQNMKPELDRLGMGVAFLKGEADFSNMYPQEAEAYISKVVHKTYIEVNEEGTEAAAATAVGIGVTSMVPRPVMNVDRPFLYFITEKTSGAVLFVGLVNNPK